MGNIMGRLIEQTFTINTLDLTEFQKILLAKAFNAGATDGNMQHIDLDGTKLTTARDILSDTDVITYDYEADTLTITPAGMELIQREGITDESGQLTDVGKSYAEGKIPPPPGTEETPPVQESISFSQYLKLHRLVD